MESQNSKTYAYEECVVKIGIGLLKQISRLLKIRGVSHLRKSEISEKIKAVLPDKDYVAKIKAKTDFEKIDFKRSMGKSLRRMENALNLPNDLSVVLLGFYEEEHNHEIAKTEEITARIFDDMKEIITRVRSEYPEINNGKIHSAISNALYRLGC